MDETCYWYDPGCWLTWLRDEIKQLGLWFLEQLLGALSAVLNAIPLPSWATDGGPLLGGIPAAVGYFLQVLEFPFGIAVIASAYGLRFLIRRIPFIG